MRQTLFAAFASALLATAALAEVQLERVTTVVPFPRGLALVDMDGDGTDELYVLARGRVRDSGGVDAALDDRAGTLWRVDLETGETTIFAQPTDPPFKLLDRSMNPPSSDRETDRPYCALRWHQPTKSFYICAFSGIDLSAVDKGPAESEGGSFSKNYTDAVLRYDTRTKAWSEVDRHDPASEDRYPGDDGRGWVKGPDNLVTIGQTVICAAKDNSVLVAYDVSGQARAPRVLLGETVQLANAGGGERTLLGHSALGYRDGWLYIGFRTSGEIIRVPVSNAEGELSLESDKAELLAEFQPWDSIAKLSANITDLAIGPDGDVYVVCAMPARIYRFTPDPANVHDFIDAGTPWADLAAMTDNPRMKSENVIVDEAGVVYVTSGDAYENDQNEGLGGTVWRVTETN